MKWGQSYAEWNTSQPDRLSRTKLVCRGCLRLMDVFSPCQGRLQRKVLPVRADCLTTGRWVGVGGWDVQWNRASTGRRGPCEMLWSTLNWSLWGQGARHSAGLSFEIFLLLWLQIIRMRYPVLIQNYLFCWLVFKIIHVCRNSGWEILVSAPSIRRMVIFDKLKDYFYLTK